MLRTLLNGIADEVTRGRISSATLLTRYAGLIVGSMIRDWRKSARSDTAGWLGVVRDPSLGRAMLAMHADPGEDWSVEQLAGMSRSNFVVKFTSMMGETPVRYVARVRMNVATMMLRQKTLTIADAAAHLGYESEASFSRAYKRVVGQSPSHART